jgi:hypothetical protein
VNSRSRRIPGKDRILVYLLVPAENPEDIAAGGHLRFDYSADGSAA